jgi:glycosyltransferase involved in cell wall biosynthesis
LKALFENPSVAPISNPPSPAPLVSILLPVKNEENNLADCLKALISQNYPAKEMIVINDNSTDRTPEILTEFSRLHPGQIKTVNASPTPPGWTGKNWALHQGIPFAQGAWLLFTDADTRHEPHALPSTIGHAEAKDLDLLTLTPRCLAEGFWEKTIQPSAMGFLGLWFPFRRVNDPQSPLAFGNGQYLLIRKKVYEKLGGHEKVKGAFLEDFALFKAAKSGDFRAECALGTKIFGTRMYCSLEGIWLGWRRIFLHAFEKNGFRLVLKSLTLFCFSFLPFFLFPFLTQLALAAPDVFGKIWGASFPILSLIWLTAWKTHQVVGASRKYAFLHPLAGLLLTGILSDAAWTAFWKKETKWR